MKNKKVTTYLKTTPLRGNEKKKKAKKANKGFIIKSDTPFYLLERRISSS